jgi:predicted neutral ceramidase superfamily lipid hydrolase
MMNVFGSGLLLLVATGLWVGATSAPTNAFKGESWAGALVVLAAALFSGFLTTVFWNQRAGRRSYYSSAILNGLSTVAFLSVVVIWVMNH